MSPQAEPKKTYTVEEYLELERHAEERHEYLRGEIFAMTGGTRRHAQLAGNLVRTLGNALRERPCLVLGSDMRVAVTSTGLLTYPDVAVVCGPPHFIDAQEDTLTNPGLLAEVLSRSTESYDRGRKFEQYRTIPSLTDYVLVSQETPLVEHFVRQSNASWVMTERRAGESLDLANFACSIPVDEIYLKVFDAPAPG